MFNTKPYRVILALIFFLSLPATHAGEPPTEPILRVELGMHTAPIPQIGVDAAERFLLTASSDKTLRLWDLHTGKLLKVYRVPIGAGNEGQLKGAISPDGEWVAGAGWTALEWDNNASIYLFNRISGKLVKRLSGLENVIMHLCFSPDGQYLGASLGSGGVRVWNTQTWQLIFSDKDYADRSEWCDFDPQNRLVTSSYDGYLRLYYPAASGSFALVAKSEAPGGKVPYAVVFSPNGDKIAVGFADSKNVNVLDEHTLAFLYAPDTTGIDNGNLGTLAWSQSGNSLYAGGMYQEGGIFPIVQWPQAGLGNYTKWQASTNTIINIRPLKNDGIVYGTFAPSFAVLDNAGNKIVEQEASIADYRYNWDGFLISHDGYMVQFGFEPWGKRPARFSLSEQNLILNPPQNDNLTQPDTTSLNVTDWKATYDWKDTFNPKLNGKALPLRTYESSSSLAIAPDKSRFLLGTSWYLRFFDTEGQQVWKVDSPGSALGVNISGDGKKAVAAYDDGTIRWYNLENGEELLAFFPHKDGQRWVAWTKSGYYMTSSDNVDNILGWHVNNGKDQAASFYPIGALYATYKRPDIVKKILVTLDEDEAIRLANLEKEEKGEVVEEPPVDVGEALGEVEDKYQLNPESSGLGKAIIIAAGSAEDSNSLFAYSNELTTEMYRFLHRKGFSDDDIIYMNPTPPVVPFGGYADTSRQDFPLREPKTELKQAIAQASRDLRAGQQFIFYLHGHAGPDSVRMSKEAEISAQELKELLDQIPTEVKQIFILDTCYSGSFLDDLAGVENRIVITSADAKTQAWSAAKVGNFSESFIRILKQKGSVGEAFKFAESTLSHYPEIFGGQRPQLDDTQDGRYTNDDGHFAIRTQIGGDKEVYAALLPEITEVHPMVVLAEDQKTVQLWVKATPDFNHIQRVRAILINEHDGVTQYQGEDTPFTRRELTLKPNDKLLRYEIDYSKFHTAKKWKILYQAQSMEGDWSEVRLGYVVGTEMTTKVEASFNKTIYRIGDNLRFDITAYSKETVDLYVGIIFPQGDFITIANPMNFSRLNIFQPYKTGIQGEQTFHVLNMELSAIARGEYQVCGLLTKHQSEAFNQANWLNLNCLEFHFQ
jgi:WD40 repeat protein